MATKRAELNLDDFASLCASPTFARESRLTFLLSSTSSIPFSSPPLSISYDSETYVLDSDRSIRRTTITPAISPPSHRRATLPLVQESWWSRLEDRSHGIDGETLVGSGTITDGGETGEGSELGKVWKEGQGKVVEACRVLYPAEEGGVDEVVFKARTSV